MWAGLSGKGRLLVAAQPRGPRSCSDSEHDGTAVLYCTYLLHLCSCSVWAQYRCLDALLQVREQLSSSRLGLSSNGGSKPATVDEDVYDDDLDQEGPPDNLDDDMLDDIASKLK